MQTIKRSVFLNLPLDDFRFWGRIECVHANREPRRPCRPRHDNEQFLINLLLLYARVCMGWLYLG